MGGGKEMRNEPIRWPPELLQREVEGIWFLVSGVDLNVFYQVLAESKRKTFVDEGPIGLAWKKGNNVWYI